MSKRVRKAEPWSKEEIAVFRQMAAQRLVRGADPTKDDRWLATLDDRDRMQRAADDLMEHGR